MLLDAGDKTNPFPITREVMIRERLVFEGWVSESVSDLIERTVQVRYLDIEDNPESIRVVV